MHLVWSAFETEKGNDCKIFEYESWPSVPCDTNAFEMTEMKVVLILKYLEKHLLLAISVLTKPGGSL